MNLAGFSTAMDGVAWRGLLYSVFILHFVFACQLLLLQPLVSALGLWLSRLDLFTLDFVSSFVVEINTLLDLLPLFTTSIFSIFFSLLRFWFPPSPSPPIFLFNHFFFFFFGDLWFFISMSNACHHRSRTRNYIELPHNKMKKIIWTSNCNFIHVGLNLCYNSTVVCTYQQPLRSWSFFFIIGSFVSGLTILCGWYLMGVMWECRWQTW